MNQMKMNLKKKSFRYIQGTQNYCTASTLIQGNMRNHIKHSKNKQHTKQKHEKLITINYKDGGSELRELLTSLLK